MSASSHKSLSNIRYVVNLCYNLISGNDLQGGPFLIAFFEMAPVPKLLYMFWGKGSIVLKI